MNIGTIAVPHDLLEEYTEYSNETHDNKLPFGVYHWYINGFYKEVPYKKSKRYKAWLRTCSPEEATHVCLKGGHELISRITETKIFDTEWQCPADQPWKNDEIEIAKGFYEWKLSKAAEETPDTSMKIEYPRHKGEPTL